MGDVFYIIYSFIGFICSIIPSFWHWKYRNVAPLCLIFWMSITNLIFFINAAIWFHGSKTKYNGNIYCDIAVKITLVSVIGQLGAITAITHYLSKIMKPNRSSLHTRSVRKKQAIEDILLSFLFPIITMFLHYIIQPKRYVINGINGCVPWIDYSWPSIIIFMIWPPIFGLLAAFYSIRVLVLYFKKWKEFQNILKDSKLSMTFSRFIRLISLSVLIVALYLPLNIYMLYVNIVQTTDLTINYSWLSVHKFSQTIFIYSTNHISFNRWLSSSNGIILFLLFGLGNDALVVYKKIAKKLYITQLYYFIRKFFFKKEKEAKNTENLYNSYDFEKSLSRCPPIFYSETKDIEIIENDSLNYYHNYPFMDYNQIYNFEDTSSDNHLRTCK